MVALLVNSGDPDQMPRSTCACSLIRLTFILCATWRKDLTLPKLCLPLFWKGICIKWKTFAPKSTCRSLLRRCLIWRTVNQEVTSCLFCVSSPIYAIWSGSFLSISSILSFCYWKQSSWSWCTDVQADLGLLFWWHNKDTSIQHIYLTVCLFCFRVAKCYMPGICCCSTTSLLGTLCGWEAETW